MDPNRDFPRLKKYVRPEGEIAQLFARDIKLNKTEFGYSFGANLAYLPDKEDHWQTQEEFLYNILTGDCEDQSFFVQSVLLAKGIPCISVWRKHHMWNEAYINGKIYERWENIWFYPKAHNPEIMTVKMRTLKNLCKKEWWWINYDAEWYKEFTF